MIGCVSVMPRYPGCRISARTPRRRFYSEHEALSERVYQRYSEKQLELLLQFVLEGREFNEGHAERVEQQNRQRNDNEATTGSAETPGK